MPTTEGDLDPLTILTFVGVYLPGSKSGGPIRSVANMVDRLGDGFQFKIITADRDYDDRMPYPTVKQGNWQRVGRANVRYLARHEISPWRLRKILNSTEYDVLYLNSLFYPQFSILPLLLWKAGLVRRTPLVIAPRGEFSCGALKIKKMRKLLYLTMARSIKLYKGVVWQASTQYEALDIGKWFSNPSEGSGSSISIAPDLLPPRLAPDTISRSTKKRPGYLRIVWVSRISKMKNLVGALKCCKKVKGAVEFNIYGPVDDASYWEECRQVIGTLPANVVVTYQGAIPHEQVAQELAQHDLFFLPTFGENFGHAIVESLSSGCPVLISDQTPWRNLEALRAGWDVPTNESDLYHHVLQGCIDMNEPEHRQLREGARAMAEVIAQSNEPLQQNRDLFVGVCKRASDRSSTFRKTPHRSRICETQKHFDKLAGSWEEKFEIGGSLRDRANAFVRRLRETVGSSGRILDFGCGPGNITIACQEAGYSMDGIDLSEAMIERAARRSTGSGIKFTVLKPVVPLTLPYARNTFNAVIASSVLEYVADPHDCLSELSRISVPGGFLILTVPNLLHSRRWLEVLLRNLVHPRYFEDGSKWQLYAEYLALSQNHLRLSNWTTLLKTSGWQVERVTDRSSPLLTIMAKKVSSPMKSTCQREDAVLVANAAE